MNPRERMLESLAHRQPDVTPYQIHFTRGAREKIIRALGDEHFEQRLGNCMVKTVCDVPGVFREIEPNLWRDQFGVMWDRTHDRDIGVVCNRVVTPDNIDSYVWPDAAEPARYDHLDEMRRANPDLFFVVKLGFSLFERAWTLTGMQELLMSLHTDPEFVERLLNLITEFNLEVIERACRHDIDAMQFGDDWGQQHGLIMGGRLWRALIKPHLCRMYQRVHDHGKFVIIHSCGKVDELFPELIAMGVDLFNPFQPEVMDVHALKETYGDRLSFYGGISTQRTLPYGKPDDVRNEVRDRLATIGRGGGYVAAPAHDIPADVPVENIFALIEELQNQQLVPA